MKRTHVPSGPPIIVHWAEYIPDTHIRVRDGLPVTCVERTLFELAAVARPRQVQDAIDEALRLRVTTVERLADFGEEFRRSGRNGSRLFRRLVDGHARLPGLTNNFERSVRRLLVQAGLPEPARQHRIEIAGKTFFLDLAYAVERVAVEPRGYEWHSRRQEWENDATRHNLLVAAGWRPVYVTWDRYLRDPGSIPSLVRATLAVSRANLTS